MQGRRGVTLCQSEGTHQIVMSFWPPVVGCLPKQSLQKERVTGTPAPPPSLATPLNYTKRRTKNVDVIHRKVNKRFAYVIIYVVSQNSVRLF